MDTIENNKQIEINSLDNLNDYISSQDNSENAFYLSKIPQMCKDSPCVLGIDEAGRGPVLGPMVYGLAFCPSDKVDILTSLECADSKDLTERKRDRIFTNLCGSSENIGWAVDIISPNKISNYMLSPIKHSLNAISMDSAVGLIKAAIDAEINIDHVYIDTVGKPESYQAYLLKLFPNLQITVAKKADSIYPIVSAASIYAKVTRDHALQVWRFQEGLELTYKDFGSGYPGDPVTKKFLRDHVDPVFGYPQLVRFSWSTASNILKEEAYHVEWGNLEEKSTSPEKPIMSFFKMGNKSKKRKEKHEFFKQRCLFNTTEI